MTTVKICGVTSVDDARMCVQAGADALGINFVPGSPRCVTEAMARDIVAAVNAQVLTVAVFVDTDGDEIARLKRAVGFRCVQLHGAEPPELLERFLPHAYKALRVRGREVLAEAARYPGAYLLLDAFVPGAAGGTGARFDWDIARELAASAPTRKLTLAGGLTPDNVAEAVAAVQPFCVDVASGVESAPGRKDAEKVRLFVERAKGLQSAGQSPMSRQEP